jgi:hypothetical protein
MLIEVDNRAVPTATIRQDRHDLELRWLVSLDGAPAAHHTLHIDVPNAAEGRFLRASLPCWSATTAAWASGLRWSLQVRPRVLRSTDPFAAVLGVTDTAAALVIAEQGSGPPGVHVEHELIVLAGFAEQALPSGWQQRASRPARHRIASTLPAWRTGHAAA